MNKPIIFGIVVVVAGIASVVVLNNRHQANNKSGTVIEKADKSGTEGSMAGKEKDMMSAEGGSASGGKNEMMDETMQKENHATPTTDSMMKKTEAMMPKAGSYLDYSGQAVAEAQKNGKKVVLFFHAAWCPYCKAADAAFKANPDKIPAEVVLLKTDYDSQTALKQKYGITYQHTFVQIDNNGNMVTKWVSGDVDLLNKNVK